MSGPASGSTPDSNPTIGGLDATVAVPGPKNSGSNSKIPGSNSKIPGSIPTISAPGPKNSGSNPRTSGSTRWR
jgi:hypothetical protein